jgi:hypothetical protein
MADERIVYIVTTTRPFAGRSNLLKAADFRTVSCATHWRSPCRRWSVERMSLAGYPDAWVALRPVRSLAPPHQRCLPVFWFIEPTSGEVQFCAIRHAELCVRMNLP